MATEIERKFLVNASYTPTGPGTPLVQGYLSATREVTVRVRRAGDAYFLTIKGRTEGLSRPEFEYEVPPTDGKELLALCGGGLVEKVRYLEEVGSHVFEVDVFSGQNAGLVVCEIELETENEEFERPTWLGPEVSAEARYTNSALARTPYLSW